ncbi:MAG: signal peptidase I [Leptospiraceae bacterium]|nr:signal peptidase I [Leptospiraceae bacterium]
MTGRSQSPSVSQNQDDSASQESGAWRRKRRLGWFLILLLFALHGRALILERVVVDGPSMKPGLQPGDGFWIQKRGRLELTFPFFRSEVWNAGLGNLKRGSVIVFHYPDASCRRQIWIKRVVALPGDKYEFRNGQLIINGENEDFALYGMDPVDTDLLPEGYQPPVADPPPEVRKLGVEAIYAALNGLQREGKVPPGSVLALGDNRSQSRDSRIIGFVPMELVLGIKL